MFLSIFIRKILGGHMFSILFGRHLGVPLPDHTVTLRLASWGTARRCSTGAAPFVPPPGMDEGSSSSPTSAALAVVRLFDNRHRAGCETPLMCIAQTTNGFEHLGWFFVCLSPLEKCVLEPVALSNWIAFFLLDCKSFGAFGYSDQYGTHDVHMFSPIPGPSFPFPDCVLCCTGVLDFDEAHGSYFPFRHLRFGVISKKPLLNPRSWPSLRCFRLRVL